MSLPRLVDVEVVAESLGLSRWRVYQLAREGVIPSVRIGKSLKFDEDKIREWIANGGSQSGEAA